MKQSSICFMNSASLSICSAASGIFLALFSCQVHGPAVNSMEQAGHEFRIEQIRGGEIIVLRNLRPDEIQKWGFLQKEIIHLPQPSESTIERPYIALPQSYFSLNVKEGQDWNSQVLFNSNGDLIFPYGIRRQGADDKLKAFLVLCAVSN